MKNRSLPKAWVAFLTIALSAFTLSAAKLEETVVNQVPLAGLSKLDLSNVNGSIKCFGKDTDIIELACTIKVKAGSDEAAQQYYDKINIEIVEDGDALVVKTKLPKRSNGFWRWISGNNVNASVDYVLNIPSSLELKLESVNGGVSVNDMAGAVDLETVNGGIKARGLSGSADVETVNGGINVEFTEALALDKMKFETVNGGVKVGLPGDAAFHLNVSTVNGGIGCDFELSGDAVKKRRHLDADINGGGPTIRIDTVNGGVNVSKVN